MLSSLKRFVARRWESRGLAAMQISPLDLISIIINPCPTCPIQYSSFYPSIPIWLCFVGPYNYTVASVRILFKGTQEWEFFWLRFWILYYFIVSYVKILRFCKKKLFDWASIGGGTIFPRSPRTRRNEKNFWARSKKYCFIFLFMNPLYELILVFPKFDPLTAPGMALCVILGPKCQNLFCLVWD